RSGMESSASRGSGIPRVTREPFEFALEAGSRCNRRTLSVLSAGVRGTPPIRRKALQQALHRPGSVGWLTSGCDRSNPKTPRIRILVLQRRRTIHRKTLILSAFASRNSSIIPANDKSPVPAGARKRLIFWNDVQSVNAHFF